MKGMIVVSNHNADLNEVWNRDLCAVEVESTNKQFDQLISTRE